MDLVLDIGNFRLKGAIFEEDNLKTPFRIPLDLSILKKGLEGKKFERILISSVNSPFAAQVKILFSELGLPFPLLDFSSVKVNLKVEEPEQVGQDRIANVYGALHHFPQNDCIVVDIGTAVTFDFIGCGGDYLGGAIYPGVDIGAKALNAYTDLLPLVEIERPESPIGKTTKAHLQIGLYWGLLGAIERIIFEMRSVKENPSTIQVIATGGGIETLGEQFSQDLSDLVDLIDPMLTLVGIHEILKEKHDVR